MKFCQTLCCVVGKVELSYHHHGPLFSFPVLEADRTQDLVQKFKDSYNKNGPYDLESQVPFLSRLAEHYESVGVSSGNEWVNLIKVRVISLYRRRHAVGMML